MSNTQGKKSLFILPGFWLRVPVIRDRGTGRKQMSDNKYRFVYMEDIQENSNPLKWPPSSIPSPAKDKDAGGVREPVTGIFQTNRNNRGHGHHVH